MRGESARTASGRTLQGRRGAKAIVYTQQRPTGCTRRLLDALWREVEAWNWVVGPRTAAQFGGVVCCKVPCGSPRTFRLHASSTHTPIYLSAQHVKAASCRYWPKSDWEVREANWASELPHLPHCSGDTGHGTTYPNGPVMGQLREKRLETNTTAECGCPVGIMTARVAKKRLRTSIPRNTINHHLCIEPGLRTVCSGLVSVIIRASCAPSPSACRATCPPVVVNSTLGTCVRSDMYHHDLSEHLPSTLAYRLQCDDHYHQVLPILKLPLTD